jgi:hypothetical protein
MFSIIQLGEKYVGQLLGMSFLQHSKLPTVSYTLPQQKSSFFFFELLCPESSKYQRILSKYPYDSFR